MRLRQTLPDVAHEECSRVRSRCDTCLADVTLDEARGESAERHDAILFAFALAGEEHALREIDVGHIETHELADAQRRRADGFDEPTSA